MHPARRPTSRDRRSALRHAFRTESGARPSRRARPPTSVRVGGRGRPRSGRRATPRPESVRGPGTRLDGTLGRGSTSIAKARGVGGRENDRIRRSTVPTRRSDGNSACAQLRTTLTPRPRRLLRTFVALRASTPSRSRMPNRSSIPSRPSAPNRQLAHCGAPLERGRPRPPNSTDFEPRRVETRNFGARRERVVARPALRAASRVPNGVRRSTVASCAPANVGPGWRARAPALRAARDASSGIGSAPWDRLTVDHECPAALEDAKAIGCDGRPSRRDVPTGIVRVRNCAQR
jgi:hypothetical protein